MHWQVQYRTIFRKGIAALALLSLVFAKQFLPFLVWVYDAHIHYLGDSSISVGGGLLLKQVSLTSQMHRDMD